jgi:hypothetical protein
MTDSHRRNDLLKNLEEWKSSPVSLLFFRSIRKLSILGEVLYWGSGGTGPVSNSEWMVSETAEGGGHYLRIWSSEEDFPAEAVEEIHQERLLPPGEQIILPPARVEIVLGFPGRLYVVLPTGVHTKLPFACNAPFIQDPARVKIKDPETSPTNRWLLARIGSLAAGAMLEWVDSRNKSVEHRVKAYSLLPNVDREDNTLDGICGRIVEEAFAAAIKNKYFLITLDEKLAAWGKAAHLPAVLYDVWPPPLVTKTFAPGASAILHPSVSPDFLKVFDDWGFIQRIPEATVLERLRQIGLPRPKSWHRLLQLWDYVYDMMRRNPYLYGFRPQAMPCIVPIQGQNILLAPEGVIRLGDKQLLQSDEDWAFIAEFIRTLNPNWVRFLAEQRRAASDDNSANVAEKVENALRLLDKFRLSNASEIGSVVKSVSDQFFNRGEVEVSDCIRITRIFAKLNAAAPTDFQYVMRSLKRRAASSKPLLDVEQDLDRFLPPAMMEERVLHDDYLHSTNESCTKEECAHPGT